MLGQKDSLSNRAENSIAVDEVSSKALSLVSSRAPVSKNYHKKTKEDHVVLLLSHISHIFL